MPMPVVHQFANGIVNPLLAYVMAFVGCLLGLSCVARARVATRGGEKVRWLIFAACAIGGAGIWVMHMMAMLGFDVPDTAIRYNVGLSAASLVLAVVVVSVGIFLVAYGKRSVIRLLAGGLFTGAGIAAMHYTGMASMRMDATVSYDRTPVIASVAIAVALSTAALWLIVHAHGWAQFIVAAAVMSLAVCGMHYTGMAAVHVRLRSTGGTLPGASPEEFLLPIMLISIAALICLLFGALAMMGDDRFALRVDRSALNGANDRLPPLPFVPGQQRPAMEVTYVSDNAKPVAHRR